MTKSYKAVDTLAPQTKILATPLHWTLSAAVVYDDNDRSALIAPGLIRPDRDGRRLH